MKFQRKVSRPRPGGATLHREQVAQARPCSYTTSMLVPDFTPRSPTN